MPETEETLLEAKTPGIIANEIIMSRVLFEGSFLLVEGPDDYKFWQTRICDGRCELIVTEGKSNLLGAIDNLNARNFIGALGIIDDDGDSLENSRMLSANIIATDGHDLECLLLQSPALERGVLAELGNSMKIERFQQQSGLTVRDRLLENGLFFGRLRWLSKRMGWQLKFEALKPERFMDREAWLVNVENLNKVAATQLTRTNTEEISDLLETLPNADPWLVCQGHDLLEILRLGLQKVLGEMKTSQGKSHIAALLRAAFHDTHLAATRLYQNIRVWERANAPYQVLPAH
ncbi:MAG: DUF4435 domain-containing protein [Candidatus Methylumidiphilus sp.]